MIVLYTNWGNVGSKRAKDYFTSSNKQFVEKNIKNTRLKEDEIKYKESVNEEFVPVTGTTEDDIVVDDDVEYLDYEDEEPIAEEEDDVMRQDINESFEAPKEADEEYQSMIIEKHIGDVKSSLASIFVSMDNIDDEILRTHNFSEIESACGKLLDRINNLK